MRKVHLVSEYLCKEFHLASSWKDRWKFIRLFKDSRIRDFAWRLCCEHDIENASEKDQENTRDEVTSAPDTAQLPLDTAHCPCTRVQGPPL